MNRRDLLLACTAVAAGRAAGAPPGAFVMGTTRPDADFAGKWLRRIYVEAFRRIDVPLEMAVYPTERLTLVLLAGDIDGEAVRGRGYGVAHPELVRVEEPTIEPSFKLYGSAAAQRLKRLNDLPTSGLRGAYPRGVVECEQALKPWIEDDRLTGVSLTEQGLSMVASGRIQFACGLDFLVDPMLKSQEFRGAGIVPLLSLGEPVPLHAYLHRRRAALAQPLAGALRAMKLEGLIDRYRVELLRELGQD